MLDYLTRLAARRKRRANPVSLRRRLTTKTPLLAEGHFRGDPTGIFLEHLFDDLFELRDRFKELGMFIEDGEVHLRDLEVKNDRI